MKRFVQRDERGVGHLGIIVVIIVVAAVGAAGWWVFKKNQEKPAKNTAQSAIQDAVANAKCEYNDKDLCKFFSGWKATKYYTINAKTTADGKTSESVYKSEGDDKFYMKATGDVPYETITIGTTLYTKDESDDKWWKQTAKTEETESYTAENNVNFEEPTADEASAKTTYKPLGKEKCGNLTCFKYQVIDPDSTETKEYIWFDDQDYQLRRTQNVTAGTTYDATFSYEKVSIKEPSPIKELGENQIIIPGQSEPMTLPDTESLGERNNYQ